MYRSDEIGPYRIVKRIAIGGMAEIFLARQRGLEGLERTVVVKRILEKLEENEEFVTMFLDEARLMAALSHPSIAQVLDLGRAEDTHYLVMEYVRGPTVGAMLAAASKREERGLPAPTALSIGLTVAEALHYVHERRDELGRPLNIVHRDLNPTNVLVSYDGAVKLIDFGIAKAATRVYETRAGVIKGTFGYIAPEALTGGEVDRRADVFALGILLYELIIGQHPFDFSDEPRQLERILHARYRRPREVRPEIAESLDRIIARCLAADPGHRYDSMEPLVHELVEHMGASGVVPTHAHLAHEVRRLIPDSEGPAPLRRPTSTHPRAFFNRDGSRAAPLPRADSTRPVAIRRERGDSTRRVARDHAEEPISLDDLTLDLDFADEHETKTVPSVPADALLEAVAAANAGATHDFPPRHSVSPPRPSLPPPGRPFFPPPHRGARTSAPSEAGLHAASETSLQLVQSNADSGSTGLQKVDRTARGPSERDARSSRPASASVAPRSSQTPGSGTEVASGHPRRQSRPSQPGLPRISRPDPVDTTLRLRALRKPAHWLGIAAVMVLSFLVAGFAGFFAMRGSGASPPKSSPLSKIARQSRTIRIVSVPPGATVILNGEISQRATPMEIRVTPGDTPTVAVSLPGFVTQSTRLNGRETEARFVLSEDSSSTQQERPSR